MKLQEYLDSIKLTEKLNPLPFIHSCEGFLGEEIVKEDELKTTVCPVFKKELLYFFMVNLLIMLLIKRQIVERMNCIVRVVLS